MGFARLWLKNSHEIWVVDLKGNAPQLVGKKAREAGNVFEDKIRLG